jgi:hypothetical protein
MLALVCFEAQKKLCILWKVEFSIMNELWKNKEKLCSLLNEYFSKIIMNNLEIFI